MAGRGMRKWDHGQSDRGGVKLVRLVFSRRSPELHATHSVLAQRNMKGHILIDRANITTARIHRVVSLVTRVSKFVIRIQHTIDKLSIPPIGSKTRRHQTPKSHEQK
jgi:hypothetical protein